MALPQYPLHGWTHANITPRRHSNSLRGILPSPLSSRRRSPRLRLEMKPQHRVNSQNEQPQKVTNIDIPIPKHYPQPQE